MRGLLRLRWSLAVLGYAALTGIAVEPAPAQSVENFYRGKTLTIIVGSDITGEHDAAARLLSRHLSKHIPGHPAVIVQNIDRKSTRLNSSHVEISYAVFCLKKKKKKKNEIR